VDWNTCIGKDIRVGHGSMGRQWAESTVNRNGRRMLEFCMDNNLLIGNTFYPHKTIHQITLESTTRGIRSTIDYFTYKKPTKYAIMDVRVFQSAELIMETRFKAPKKEKGVTYKKSVLREVEKRVEYARKIQERLKAKEEEIEEREIWDVEEMWRIFKE
jgi:hypothetical protein